MKQIVQLIYLTLQFHWRELLIFEITVPSFALAVTRSFLVYFLVFIIVFVSQVWMQNKRHKKGII